MIKWVIFLFVLISLGTATGANFWPVIKALVSAAVNVDSGGQCT